MSRASVVSRLRAAGATTAARSSGWLLLGAALGRIAGMASTLVLSRILIPREFGRLALMQYLVTFLAGFAGGGLSLAVRRQVAAARTRDQAAAGRYVGLTVAFTAVGSLLVVAVCVLAPRPIAELLGQDQSLNGLVPLTAIGAAVTAIALAAQSALVGLESFSVLARAQIIQSFAVAIAMIAGAQLHGTTGALLGLAIGQSGATVLSLVMLHRSAGSLGVPIQYGLYTREARRLWRVGVPAFVAFLAGSTALLFGQTQLSQSSHGYASLAAFNVAYRWHLGLLFLPTSALPMLLPMLTRYHAESRGDDVRRTFRITMWATVLIVALPAIVIIALSEPLLSLSGSFYAHHQGPLILLACAAIPAAINNVLSSAGVSLNIIRAWLVSDVVLAATLVTAALLLVAGDGASGLAVAYLAAYVATDVALAGPLRRALAAPMGASPT